MGEPVAIVGAGAAGLLAAITAAERCRVNAVGPRVLLLEAAREPGRKILVSGGGRCNVLPLADRPERFVSSSPPRLVHRFLARFPHAAQRAFFEELLGGPLREEPRAEGGGKLFPPGIRSRDVRDALLALAWRLGVEVLPSCPVSSLAPRPGGGFLLGTAAGTLEAACAVLATGGRSVLPAGADARGLEWAAAFGHTVRSLHPALVPLTASGAPHAALAGLSLPARVVAESGAFRAEAAGGFLFTHRGYSGPSVLDVSHVVAAALAAGGPFRVAASFGGDGLDWEEALRTGAGHRAPVLAKRLPERLVAALLEAAGTGDVPLRRLTREARRAVVAALTGLPLPVDGTEGYRTAEVTAGGVALEEVDAGSGESKVVPGLFLAGEMLDATGPIGGFNFQWAWATGRTAGDGVARAVTRPRPGSPTAPGR